MADKKEDIDITDESGGKSKLLLIIIAVLVLALIGVGAWLFMGNDTKSDAPDEAKVAAPVKQAPIYAEIKQPLIVNFSRQSKGAVRYLSIKIKVMARNQAAIDAFKLHTPAIQHALLLLFFGQDYQSLNTTQGIKALKKATLDTINAVLKQEKADEIEAVYFTNLIMQ